MSLIRTKKAKTAERTKLTKTDFRDAISFRLVLLPFIVTLLASSVSAQTDSSSVSGAVTLDYCIAVARSNSPELRVAANAVDAAKFNRTLISKSRLPQFRFSGDASYAPMSLSFGYDPAVSNGGAYGARVVAEQTLYSGGLHSLQMKAAGTDVDRSSIGRLQQDRDLVYAVKLAFIELLRSQQVLAQLETSVDRLSDYTSLVARLNKAGTVGNTDFLRVQVELTRAQIDVTAADGSVRSARLNLARILGEPDDSMLVVSGTLDSLLINIDDTLGSIRAKPATENLDMSAARLDYARSQLALSMLKSQWKPKAALSADAGVVTSRENLLLPAPDRYNSIGYSVGVNVEMPLLDWGARRTDVKRGQLEVKSAQDNIDLLQRDIRAEFSDTRSRLSNASDRLKSTRLALQTADKVYLLSLAQYSDGISSAYEVLTAQQTLTDVRQSEIEILAEMQSLQAQLDRITTSIEDGKQ